MFMTIYELVQPLVPHSMEAFMDFRVNAMQLTGPEIEAIKLAERRLIAINVAWEEIRKMSQFLRTQSL